MRTVPSIIYFFFYIAQYILNELSSNRTLILVLEVNFDTNLFDIIYSNSRLNMLITRILNLVINVHTYYSQVLKKICV